MYPILRLAVLPLLFAPSIVASPSSLADLCHIQPLGPGRDDTSQIEAAIAECGHFGSTVLDEGVYNVTRKMTWDLKSSKVDLRGVLNFQPDIQYWLNANNTYRVIFIQSQASWFVITGTDFTVDAHDTGGIDGNGQIWWNYFANRTREDGDGRPVSLTLSNVTRGTIANFRVQSPPFWCNAIAQSQEVVYNGMLCNATNENPAFFGTNIVPNTDGIDTYRSDNIQLLNFDITCGDDCLAIKGVRNSSNIVAKHITCRGGNGVAIGSLGQYGPSLPDFVTNLEMDDIKLIRLNSSIQPNMASGVYFKTWDGSINGQPPTGGGGAGGKVSHVTARNVQLDRVNTPMHLQQTNGGHSGDLRSKMTFDHLSFINWTGTAITNKIVDVECSTSCSDIAFSSFDVQPPTGEAPRFICINTTDVSGLPAPCNATGEA